MKTSNFFKRIIGTPRLFGGKDGIPYDKLSRRKFKNECCSWLCRAIFGVYCYFGECINSYKAYLLYIITDLYYAP